MAWRDMHSYDGSDEAASYWEPPKPPKSESHRYDLPWDDWPAFISRAVAWVNWPAVIGLSALSCASVAWVWFALGLGPSRAEGEACRTRHERSVLELSLPSREGAYEGLIECRNAWDNPRAAYFDNYLRRTLPSATVPQGADQ